MRKKILIITLSNIGDVILTTPVISVMAYLEKDAEIDIVSGPKAVSFFEGHEWIRQTVVYDKKVSWLKKLSFIRELRKKHYDMVIDLRHSLIPYFIRARRRSRLVRLDDTLLMRERHLNVLRQMGISTRVIPDFPFYQSTDEETVEQKLREEGIEKHEKYILAAPYAASGLKTWPAEKFQQVFRDLIKSRPEKIILAGDSREAGQMEVFTRTAPDRFVNLAGRTTLKELAVLVDRSSLLLSNDSAIMHLGFEMNKKVAAIFGPTHHEKYGRTGRTFRIIRQGAACSPCQKPVCLFPEQICFTELEPAKVTAACLELLQLGGPNR